jgi:hypothetical protein
LPRVVDVVVVEVLDVVVDAGVVVDVVDVGVVDDVDGVGVVDDVAVVEEEAGELFVVGCVVESSSVPETLVSCAKTVLTPVMENDETTGRANAVPTATRLMNRRRSNDGAVSGESCGPSSTSDTSSSGASKLWPMDNFA